MEFDIFFSIAHTPDSTGHTPSEAEMFSNFFEQLELADELGFGVGWVAQSHLSTEVQKGTSKPVIPHWEGEVGLCTDFFQLAQAMLARTSRIEVGSAVMSLFCNGGPIGMAERIGSFLALHGLDPEEERKLNIGFSAGRFEFMARPYGIVPRDAVEQAAWPALRGQIFIEACDIFLRLLRGDIVSSADTRSTILTQANFRNAEDWSAVQAAAMQRDGSDSAADEIEFAKRWEFEQLKTIPQEWRRDLLELVAGTHDPSAQQFCNEILPVKVFNLSITSPEVIDATHERMARCYHSDGGEWQRRDMPRTVFVFINEEQGLTAEQRSAAAHGEAEAALGSYWRALEGTLDPTKVAKAANNALIGTAAEIREQIEQRFHPEDRLMTWFDFFNHDSKRVCSNMRNFMQKVAVDFEVE